MDTTTLRPGLLVCLKTSRKGDNVSYAREDIEKEHITNDGVKIDEWNTKRTTVDPTEYELAKDVRAMARNMVAGVCAKSSFGLLCAEENAEKLEAKIREANELTRKFNETAKITEVNIYTITGRIEPNDAEAVRAINAEVTDLLDKMQTGIKKLDVDMVRKAAAQARQLGTMLKPEANERIQEAIKAARKVARQINKAGEVASTELNEIAIKNITEARTAFLELDEPTTVPTEAPEAEGRAIDLEPEELCSQHGCPTPCNVCSEELPEELPEAAVTVPAFELE